MRTAQELHQIVWPKISLSILLLKFAKKFDCQEPSLKYSRRNFSLTLLLGNTLAHWFSTMNAHFESPGELCRKVQWASGLPPQDFWIKLGSPNRSWVKPGQGRFLKAKRDGAVEKQSIIGSVPLE